MNGEYVVHYLDLSEFMLKASDWATEESPLLIRSVRYRNRWAVEFAARKQVSPRSKFVQVALSHKFVETREQAEIAAERMRKRFAKSLTYVA